MRGDMVEAIPTGKIRFKTHVGAELTITQLSLYARRKLQQRAQTMHPLPNPKQFERVMEGIPQLGSDEPAVMRGEETAEYQAALSAAREKQVNAVTEMALLTCIECTEKEQWLQVYVDDLATIRSYADDLPDDDWLATLKCFLTSEEDMSIIANGISQSLPLTNEEVVDSYAYFRISIPRSDIRRVTSNQRPPRPYGSIENQAQRSTG